MIKTQSSYHINMHSRKEHIYIYIYTSANTSYMGNITKNHQATVKHTKNKNPHQIIFYIPTNAIKLFINTKLLLHTKNPCEINSVILQFIISRHDILNYLRSTYRITTAKGSRTERDMKIMTSNRVESSGSAESSQP